MGPAPALEEPPGLHQEEGGTREPFVARPHGGVGKSGGRPPDPKHRGAAQGAFGGLNRGKLPFACEDEKAQEGPRVALEVVEGPLKGLEARALEIVAANETQEHDRMDFLRATRATFRSEVEIAEEADGAIEGHRCAAGAAARGEESLEEAAP